MPFLIKCFTRTMDKHQKENIRAIIYVHLFCKKYCEKIISGKRLKNKEKCQKYLFYSSLDSILKTDTQINREGMYI